jgi:hypothetical protein
MYHKRPLTRIHPNATSCVLGILMADILEHEGYFWVPDFCTEQVIMVVLELRICKVIPPKPTHASSVHAFKQVLGKRTC